MIGNQLLPKGSPILIWGTIQVRTKKRNEKYGSLVIADNFQLLEKEKNHSINLEKQCSNEELISWVFYINTFIST